MMVFDRRMCRQSFPIDALRNEGFRRIELGVLPAVRALIRFGATPIWSCAGHQRYPEPSVWFPRSTWRLVRGRPYVICAGPRISRSTNRSAVYNAMRLLEEGRGPLRLFYLHIPRTPNGENLRYRIRWCKARNFFAVVFADRMAVFTGDEQERLAAGRRVDMGRIRR